MPTPRERRRQPRMLSGRRPASAGPRPAPIDFDLTVLLKTAGAAGITLDALTILVRDIVGPAVTLDRVRAELRHLLARGLVELRDNRWYAVS